MNIDFLINRNKGNDMLHARFIIGKVDCVRHGRYNAINHSAALCMGNKKVRLDFL